MPSLLKSIGSINKSGKSRILALQRKAFCHQPIGMTVLFIQGENRIAVSVARIRSISNGRNAFRSVAVVQI